jgi:hypothetical protein
MTTDKKPEGPPNFAVAHGLPLPLPNRNAKVFCCNCKYFREGYETFFGSYFKCKLDECLATKHYCHNATHEWIVYGDPRVVNANNNCKLYEPKTSVWKRIKIWMDYMEESLFG